MIVIGLKQQQLIGFNKVTSVTTTKELISWRLHWFQITAATKLTLVSLIMFSINDIIHYQCQNYWKEQVSCYNSVIQTASAQTQV